MAAIGASGLSVALGLYNTTQIMSLKKEIDEIIKAPTVSNTPVPQSVPLPPVVSAPVVETTSFSQSDSSEITELQTTVGELQAALNVTSLAATTNTSNATIKSDELEALEIFVGEEMVSVRGRVSTNENSISANASRLDDVDQAIIDINAASVTTNNRIDSAGTDISALDGRVGNLETRATTSEDDISTISGDVTQLTADLDALGDELDNEATLLEETKAALENFRADWNEFNDVAFLGNEKLNVTNLSASNCNIGLNHSNGDISAIRFAGLTNPNWWMYLAKAGAGKSPKGETPKSFGVVNDYAIRMDIGGGTKQGLIFENSATGPVASLSAAGIFQNGPAKCGELSPGVAGFGHQGRFTGGNVGFSQGSDGVTNVSAGNSKFINFYNNGKRSARFESNNRLVIENHHASGRESVFSHSDGNNYIRSASNCYFGFGSNATTTVTIKNKEINIDGFNMLAELKALKTRVSNLEGKNYVLNGQSIYLKNANNSRYLRKASSSNDGIIDTTTKDSRSRFTVVK